VGEQQVRETGLDDTYLSSSSLSNFLGFLGQHSHMNAPPMRGALPALPSLAADCADIARATVADLLSGGFWER